MDKYYGDWSSKEDMLEAFGIPEDVLDGYNVVLALYENGGYDGSAFVLLEKDGEYFEVNGSHCSCYGLENQWGLEDAPPVALKHRIDYGHGYGAFSMAEGAIKQHFGW